MKSNIELTAREKYTGEMLPKFNPSFYVDEDTDVIGYFDVTYPGWNITGRYEFNCEQYKAEPVISVVIPDGVYYLTRIGSDFLNVNRARDKWEDEERLKVEAEGEIEIKNGKLISFTPHYDIFGEDHLIRIRRCERSMARV